MSRYRELLVERFQLDVDRKIRALSKGNRQKVQLVAAFATRADLLILDEPTSGLDPLMEMAFRETVLEAKERGQTVFLSSHMLSEVEAVCDRVGILRNGRLVDEGTLAELRHLSVHTVEVTFAGPAPELGPLEGVHVVETAGNVLRLEVSGAIQPLLAALGGQQVVSLTAASRRSRRSSSTTTRTPAVVRAASALARRTLANGRISTGSFALLFLFIAFVNPVGYRRAYPTAADRLAFAQSFGANKIVQLFYGDSARSPQRRRLHRLARGRHRLDLRGRLGADGSGARAARRGGCGSAGDRPRRSDRPP